MAITLNKKICLEFFGIFLGGFRSTVSKFMGRIVYRENKDERTKNFVPPLENV